MATNRADGLETRRRLLDAAGALFAASGFRETKVADICRAARANIAAVNYHFGSKEGLYVEAWRHEFERSIAAYPPDGGVPPEASAKARLRGHIQGLVKKFMDPSSRDLDIGHREMAHPTGLLAEVIHRAVEPQRRIHLAIVRELLGPRADERDVQLCEMSVHAQCFAALMHERHRRSIPQGGRPSGPAAFEIGAVALAEHVARFSLAGIREVRRLARTQARSARDIAGEGDR